MKKEVEKGFERGKGFMRILIGFLFALGIFGQQPIAPTTIPLAENPLPSVGAVGTIYSGVGGNQQYCYFVVARYAIGNAQISNGQCVTVNPQGGGNVVVSWGSPNIPNVNAPKYSLAYDVVRLTSSSFNSSCSNCLLASATTANTVTDSFAPISVGYNANTYGPGVLNYAVDNTSTDRAIAYDVPQGGAKRQADIRHGTVLPTYCNLGDQFILDTNQTSALCGNSNNWVIAAGGGTVTGVTATAPVTSSGGSSPNIACPTCLTSSSGVTAVTGTSPVVSSGGSTPAISCPTCTVGGVTAVTASGLLASSGGTTPDISCSTCGTGTVTGVTGTSPIVSTGGVSPVISCPTCSTSSGTVTSVTATAPLTSSGGTTPVISATYQGNGSKVQASTGSTTTDDCVKFDVNGNTVDAGAACTTATTSNQNLRSIGVTFTGNGSALSGTSTDCQEITSSGTISSVYTVADVSGSVTVGISSVAYASYTGIAGAPYTDIVNGGTAPSLSSAVKYTDSTLTSWLTTLTAGQIICFQVSSPATVQNVKVKVIYAAN